MAMTSKNNVLSRFELVTKTRLFRTIAVMCDCGKAKQDQGLPHLFDGVTQRARE